jgi:hypothetical protein
MDLDGKEKMVSFIKSFIIIHSHPEKIKIIQTKYPNNKIMIY